MRHYVNVLEGHTFVNISGSTLFNITPTPPSNKETGFASYLLIYKTRIIGVLLIK